MSSDLPVAPPAVSVVTASALNTFIRTQPPGLLETLRSGAVWQRVEDLAARRALGRARVEKDA